MAYEHSIVLSEHQLCELSQITNPEFGSNNWKLVYRGTRDGFKPEDFHAKCDEIQPTLVLFKSDNGSVFGGYNPVKWNIKPNCHYKAAGTFIFGFEENGKGKIIKILCKEDYESVYCGQSTIPCFNSGWGDGIFVMTDCDSGKSSYVGFHPEGGYVLPEELDVSEKSDYVLNGGEEYFRVDELEVFTVKQNNQEREDLKERIEFVVNDRDVYMDDDCDDDIGVFSINVHDVGVCSVPKLLLFM